MDDHDAFDQPPIIRPVRRQKASLTAVQIVVPAVSILAIAVGYWAWREASVSLPASPEQRAPVVPHAKAEIKASQQTKRIVEKKSLPVSESRQPANLDELLAKHKSAGKDQGEHYEALAALVEKEKRYRAKLRAFGALNDAEQRLALQAARRLAADGIETLSDDQKLMILRAGFGNELEQKAVESAQRDPLCKEFCRILELQADQVYPKFGMLNADERRQALDAAKQLKGIP